MRILIVEDEAPLRASVAERLRAEGFTVDEAGDGEEGLYFGQEFSPDVASSTWACRVCPAWT